MEDGARVGRFAAWTTLVFSAAFLFFFLIGHLPLQSRVLDWGREDGPVEYLGAIFWGAASVVCITRLVRARRQPALLTAFWGALAFLSMGEEVSWFQRVLDIDTPEPIRQVNGQGELNLHNLSLIDFGPIFNIQQAFHLGFFCYFLVLPLLMAWNQARALAARVGYTPPHRSFLLMVWVVIVGSYAVQKLGAEEAVRIIAESRETFFAFTVLSYVSLYVGGARAQGGAR